MVEQSGRQTERDDCVAVLAGIFFDFLQQARFQVVGVGLHFARRNLLVRRALKTQLAYTQTAFRSYRRTEDAAGHGAGFIELAVSSFRIEHWARLVVGEIGKLLLGVFAFVEHATDGIARKIRRQARDRLASPLTNLRRALRSPLLQLGQPSPQAESVQLIDRECAKAALRAAGAANQPFSASPRHVGQRGVHDLDQLLISARWKAGAHAVRITHS